MANIVPVVHKLDEIYSSDTYEAEKRRWSQIQGDFHQHFGHPPTFMARSPGRVNIIGEHIDYSLYSVLPMAISADVVLAVSLAEPKDASDRFRIQIFNTNSHYPPRSFDLQARAIDIDSTTHEWSNYFKSGLRCALQILQKTRGSGFRPKCMRVLVDGSVPAGSGLSSSAAFTTASALAVLYANGEHNIDKQQLTELAIVSERAAGVNSGGMDQAASVFSARDSALYVSFHPSLTAEPVHFPKTSKDVEFLVAQSFVVSDKARSGLVCYNLRVVECSLAAAYLHARLAPQESLRQDSSPLGVSLRGFHAAYLPQSKLSIKEQLQQLVEITRSTLSQEEGYTREEIAQVIGTSVSDLNNRYTSKFPVRAEKFKLRQRALHVFTEAVRVLDFLALLSTPDDHLLPTEDSSPLSSQLGNIMNEAQTSARDVYDCSCPELDRICEIARAAGAYGSRLTGAGWGGCTVHMVARNRVEDVKRALQEQYYDRLDLTPEQHEEAFVVSRPGSGSAILQM